MGFSCNICNMANSSTLALCLYTSFTSRPRMVGVGSGEWGRRSICFYLWFTLARLRDRCRCYMGGEGGFRARVRVRVRVRIGMGMGFALGLEVELGLDGADGRRGC